MSDASEDEERAGRSKHRGDSREPAAHLSTSLPLASLLQDPLVAVWIGEVRKARVWLEVIGGTRQAARGAWPRILSFFAGRLGS